MKDYPETGDRLRVGLDDGDWDSLVVFDPQITVEGDEGDDIAVYVLCLRNSAIMFGEPFGLNPDIDPFQPGRWVLYRHDHWLRLYNQAGPAGAWVEE